jgi:hypothetical protein
LKCSIIDRAAFPEEPVQRFILATLVPFAFICPANAQQSNLLPEIMVGGDAPSTVSQRCVDVEIGGSHGYNCLNLKLRQQVDRINPSMNIPPVDARSADIRVGVVNMPAVQQQYGRNFGVSVIPYRPARPVYTSPIVRR